jgi:murein DD-endopeptidase MepM/ murein hydrolase activator NlpD
MMNPGESLMNNKKDISRQSGVLSKCFFPNDGKNILRLALIVCLVQLLLSFNVFIPHSSKNLVEIPAAQTGVGGGSQLDNVVSGDEAVAVESIISGVRELESFSKPRMLFYSSYTVQKGDIIGILAAEFGLTQDTLISVNGIKNTRLIQIGQVLRIPNQDGILHTVKNGETPISIAEKYNSDPGAIKTANELFSDNIHSETVLFVPGARLDSINLREINGDLFIWPASGYISSPYGYRASPFTGVRQFHSGLDISAAMGSPIRAAMSGRVSAAGFDNIFGNYVVISHHSGYRTLYGHMSVIRVKSGAYVGTGDRIGDVGSTGLSTGPHLHFTVYKNGITVNPRTLMR